MKFLPYFLFIYLYVRSRILNAHIYMERTIDYVLDVYHL